MNSDLIKDFNLPSYIKGKSFAEASKAIDKKFSERTDSAALETKEELLGRLAKAQEFVKMQESLKANSSEVPDMMGGQVPEGFEEFAPQQGQMALGGVVGEGLAKGATGAQQADAIGGIAGAAGTALQIGNQVFGDTGIDETGLAGRQEKTNVGMGAAGGALQGVAAGASFGPLGAAIGGVIGGVGGLIGGSRKNKAIHEGNMNASRIENNKYSNDFALGGFTDPTDPRKKKVATDTTKVNDTIFAVEPIHPVGGIQDRVNVGPETPKLDGSAQAAYLDTVKYAGRKKAKPGDVNPNAGLPPAGAFDNQFIDYPAAEPEVITPTSSTGAPANREIRTVFDNQFVEVPREEKPVGKSFGPKNEHEMTIFDYPVPEQTGTAPVVKTDTTETETAAQTESTENTTIDGTVTEKEATPEQRKAMEVLSLKYKPSGVQDLTTGLAGSAKASTDSLAKTNAQRKARDKKIADIIAEHEANKPEGFKLNASRLAEFAPAAMSAYQLATLKKPTQESLDRIDSRYKTDYVDEKSLENRVQNEHNNVSRSLAGASNGSMGALRANLLGANKNKVEAMNDAYLKADDINRQEDRAAQQFNSRNDMVNLQQSNREKENAARDKAAYENNKSMLLSTIGDNIGAIGREATDRKTIAKMFGYDVEGNYVVGKDGKRKTWKEFNKEVKAYQKKNK